MGVYDKGYVLGAGVKFALSAFEPAWQPFVYSQLGRPDAARTLARLVIYAWLAFACFGLGVAVFGVCFVVVSSRIVGLIGVSSNPTSAMTLVTLLGVSVVFVMAGWSDPSARAAILTVGTVVCIAASKAGDISQDLKTGFLVGATPARQQFGQFVGAAFACWAISGTVFVIFTAWLSGLHVDSNPLWWLRVTELG